MYVRVKVKTKSRQEQVTLIAPNRLSIAVKEPAQFHLANRRVVELVAAYYGVAPAAVRIISGHHSPTKLLSLPD